MSEKDIRNLVLLGLGGFALYMIFFRKSALAVPFPATVTVTPQVFGTGALPVGAMSAQGFPTPLPSGSMSPQGFPATPNDSGSGTNYDYVLVE